LRSAWPAHAQPASGTAHHVVLSGAITLKDGAVRQSSFHDYQMPCYGQMPTVEVLIFPSTNKRSGVGGPGTTPIRPAIANALAMLTGEKIRSLPFSMSGVTVV
jgi:isoquinoline 1-oxidoreductase beta subunit